MPYLCFIFTPSFLVVCPFHIFSHSCILLPLLLSSLFSFSLCVLPSSSFLSLCATFLSPLLFFYVCKTWTSLHCYCLLKNLGTPVMVLCRSSCSNSCVGRSSLEYLMFSGIVQCTGTTVVSNNCWQDKLLPGLHVTPTLNHPATRQLFNNRSANQWTQLI